MPEKIRDITPKIIARLPHLQSAKTTISFADWIFRNIPDYFEMTKKAVVEKLQKTPNEPSNILYAPILANWIANHDFDRSEEIIEETWKRWIEMGNKRESVLILGYWIMNNLPNARTTIFNEILLHAALPVEGDRENDNSVKYAEWAYDYKDMLTSPEQGHVLLHMLDHSYSKAIFSNMEYVHKDLYDWMIAKGKDVWNERLKTFSFAQYSEASTARNVPAYVYKNIGGYLGTFFARIGQEQGNPQQERN